MLRLRTCNKCGWVYFGISRKEAEDEVHKFNSYYNALTPKEQRSFYGGAGSSITTYEKCHCGNPCTNFRESKFGDCPDGCTVNPIIYEE